MARVPTDQEVQEAQAAAAKAEEEKRLAQEAEGKTFVNNGQGVMTEEAWQRRKTAGGEQSNG